MLKLMLTGDIAALLGIRRQSVQELVLKPGFPKPHGTTQGGVRVWKASDVERWAKEHRPPK